MEQRLRPFLLVFSSFEMLKNFNFTKCRLGRLRFRAQATEARLPRRSPPPRLFWRLAAAALSHARVRIPTRTGRRGEKIEHTKRGGGQRGKKSKCGEPGADHERTHKKSFLYVPPRIIHAGNGSRILEKSRSRNPS